ncbi:MAG: permease [Smithellaceae bacterium]
MGAEFVVALGGMSWHHILFAFAGGIFASAFGAFAFFILVGIAIVAGCAVMAAGGSPAFLFNVGISYGTGFMGFAGSCAAAAYAGWKGYIPSGRDVTAPGMGMKHVDVLLVGGIFGVIGALMIWLLMTIMPLKIGDAMWTDCIALGLTLTTIIERYMFGKSGLFGKVPEGQSRFKFQGENVWLPWQQTWLEILVLGIGFGFASSYLALIVGLKGGGIFICFGLSLVSLIFLMMGMKTPVTHHITLVAGIGAAASGSVIWGGLFGIMAAYVAQFYAGLFLVYADTYIDPAAATIATMTTVSVLLGAAGIFTMLPFA